MSDKTSSGTYWYWDKSADDAIYAQLLIERWDIAHAGKILEDLSISIDIRSYYTSTQTKIQFLTALIRLTSLNNNKKDIAIELRSDGFIAGLSLLWKAYYDSLTVSRDITSDRLVVSRKDAQTPVFYELIQYDHPKSIFSTKPKSAFGMGVTRTFELVDESKWVDSMGNWIITKPLESMQFKKWQLYRVTLTVTPPVTSLPVYYLTLEDFMPGWWRPIRGVFKTESQAMGDNHSSWYHNTWSQVEARADRILATADILWSDDPRTYIYYIRPEYAGTFLLPPVTAYYMYRPEVHAVGTYEKIEVQ
jgi:hypothetical protein